MMIFHYILSDDRNQYTSTTATHPHILLHLILCKRLIKSLLVTVRYHIDGFTNQHHFAYDIYLLSYLALYFLSIFTELLVHKATASMLLVVLIPESNVC